jgi:hypothetical protein
VSAVAGAVRSQKRACRRIVAGPRSGCGPGRPACARLGCEPGRAEAAGDNHACGVGVRVVGVVFVTADSVRGVIVGERIGFGWGATQLINGTLAPAPTSRKHIPGHTVRPRNAPARPTPGSRALRPVRHIPGPVRDLPALLTIGPPETRPIHRDQPEPRRSPARQPIVAAARSGPARPRQPGRTSGPPAGSAAQVAARPAELTRTVRQRRKSGRGTTVRG